jgi:hypothetical protein
MFLTLMVGFPGSLSAPLRGPPSTFSSVDGGRSRISDTASQGVRRRHFFSVGGKRSQTSGTASQGGIDVFQY